MGSQGNPNRPTSTPHNIVGEKDFGQQIRTIYSLMRHLHHLYNVSTECEEGEMNQPPTFGRLSEFLADVIKPAGLSDKTRDLLIGNAKNWAYNTQLILEDHYNEVIQTTLMEIKNTLDTNWRLAFDIATKWCKRKFKRRLRQETVEQLEEILASSMETLDQEEPMEPPDPKQQVTGQQIISKEPNAQKSCTSEKKDSVQDQSSFIQKTDRATSPISDHSWSPAPGTPAGTPQGQRLPRVLTLKTPKHSKQKEVSHPQTPPSRETTANNHPPEVQALESPVEVSSSSDYEDSVCSEDGEDFSTHEGEAFTQEDDLSLLAEQFSVHGDEETPNFLTQQEDANTGTPDEETIATVVSQESSPTKNTLENPEKPPCSKNTDGSGEQPLAEGPRDPSQTVNPSDIAGPSPKQKPNFHPHFSQKSSEWHWKVTKKWLFIGDSNLNRIPPYTKASLQIESFSGATFRNMEQILTKLTPQMMVEKLVLSVGINARTQKAKETTVKQLQRALRAAKIAFPASEIWIPLINYSDKLPQKEQDALSTINDHIKANMPFISLLPKNKFTTERDNVHWTALTAQAMLDHWSKRLNLVAH